MATAMHALIFESRLLRKGLGYPPRSTPLEVSIEQIAREMKLAPAVAATCKRERRELCLS